MMYSRGEDRYGNGYRDTLSKVSKLATSGVIRDKLGNLLENFKSDIIGTLSLWLDTLQIKKNQEEVNANFSIFFSRCRKKHALRACLLNIN